MIRFFLSLYYFFKKQRALLYLLLFLLTTASIYFAAKIRFVENTNHFMPRIKNSEYVGKVFKQIKIKDKIILLISEKDSTKQADPEQMIAAGESFLDSLRSSPTGTSHIKDILFEVNDTITNLLIRYTLDNFPVFLDSADYARLDTLLLPENIKKQMNKNYDNSLYNNGIMPEKMIFSDPLGISGNNLKNLRDLQLNMPYEIYRDHIFSTDHRYLLAIVSPQYGAEEVADNEPFVEEIEHRIEQLSQLFPDIEVNYFGKIPINVYNARQIKADSIETMIITLSIISLVVLLTFRRKSAVPLIIAPVLFGGILASAIVFLIQGSISFVVVGAGSAILGIATSYSIPVFYHSLHIKTAEQLIRDLTYPMAIGCLSAIGGIIGLSFYSSEILYDFGLFTCLTLIGTSFFCLIFLPHLLVFRQQKGNRIMYWIEKFNAYSFEKNNYLLILAVIATGLCLYFFNGTRFNSDMMKQGACPDRFARAENILMNTFSDEYKSVSFVSVGNDRDKTLYSYLRVSMLLEKLYQQGVINDFSSATHLFISEKEQERRIQMWNNYWTPKKKATLKKNIEEAGRKYKFKPAVFREFFERLNKKYQPVDFDQPDFYGSQLPEEWIETSGDLTMAISQVRLSETDKDKVYGLFRHSKEMVILDRPYFAEQMAKGLHNNFNTIFCVASFFIFLFILINYGRIEITLLTFLLIAAGWFSSFIFGIGNNFSIFITNGLLSEYKTGRTLLNIHKTAIFFSAFSVITGLSMLSFSHLPALQSISAPSIVGVLLVMAISFSVQPFIFRWLISDRAAEGKFPHTWVSLSRIIVALFILIVGGLLLTILSGLIVVLPFGTKQKKHLSHYLVYWIARYLLRIMTNVKKIRRNSSKEKFREPAIIIANRQSPIDVLRLLALHPKLIMVTKSWVTHSSVFGRIARYLGFVDVPEGCEQSENWLKEQMNEGYSIVVFPEGSSASDYKIGRFQDGVFLLAERLNADIVPVMLHGNGQVLSKDDPFYLKNGTLALKILPRITYSKSNRYGTTYKEKTEGIFLMFTEEYAKFMEKVDVNNPYFRYKLIKNFTYKGFALEWYLRMKIAKENDYNSFDSWVPKQAKVTDIGCGYGFMSYMLAFKSEQRFISGIDCDEKKITMAKRNFSFNDRMEFIAADVSEIVLEPSDVFILNDVLHCLTKEKQTALLKQCVDRLHPDGMIILSNGERTQKSKHKRKRLSAKYMSTHEIRDFAKSNSLLLITLENDKHNSSAIYVIQKNKEEIG